MPVFVNLTDLKSDNQDLTGLIILIQKQNDKHVIQFQVYIILTMYIEKVTHQKVETNL